MKEESEKLPTFYSDVGLTVKRWWKSVERFGFEVAIADIGIVVDDEDDDNDNDESDSEYEDESDNEEDFIGDSFVKGVG